MNENMELESLIPLSSRRQLYDFFYQVESMRSGNPLEINIINEVFTSPDIDKLEEAYGHLIKRHEGLRLTFHVIDNVDIKQKIHEYSPERFKLIHLDWSTLDAEQQKVEQKLLQDRIEDAYIELGEGPLIQGILIRRDATHYKFELFIHHILADGYSMRICLAEILEIYNDLVNNRDVTLSTPRMSYQEYLKLRDENISDSYLEKFNNYWTTKLIDNLKSMDYETFYNSLETTFSKSLDRSILTGTKEFSGGKWISYETMIRKDELNELPSQLGVPMQIAFMASFVFTCHISYVMDEFLMACMIPGRDRKESRMVVGNLFANLFLKNKIDPSVPMSELIIRIYKEFMQSCRYPIFNFDNFYTLPIRNDCEFLFNFIQAHEHKSIESAEHLYMHKPDKEFMALSHIIDEYKDAFVFRWVYLKGPYSAETIETLSKIHQCVFDALVLHKDLTWPEFSQVIKENFQQIEIENK